MVQLWKNCGNKLLQRIQTVADSGQKDKYKVLNDLLEKSFPVIKVNACDSRNKRQINKDSLQAASNFRSGKILHATVFPLLFQL